MSYDDDHRGNPNSGPNSGRDRGAYTPPTGDDDLPFSRGGYDPRRAPAQKSPPITLIVSAVILLLLVVAVVMFYRSGVRNNNEAPPAVGTQVETMKVDAPLDAQPVNPEDGISVYRDAGVAEGATPTFTEGPEEVLPRPAPSPEPAPTATPLAPAAPAPAPKAAPTPAPASKAATPAPAPAPAPKAAAPAPAPAAATGSSRVQIGAFSSTAIADREYAAVASRFGQYASGAGKGVEEVTTASGSTVYRTTFTGMSRERAVAFCNALKAAGRDCLVR